jgi:propanol-preferring alcohol dehydrogenase
MNLMRCQRLRTPAKAEQSPLVLEECPLPEPGAGQVRVKLTYCGVCHTDLHIAEGDIHPPRLPITPGHQAVGVIDAIGPPLPEKPPLSRFAGEGSGVRGIGQRVGVPWLHAACGVCDFCRRGQENLCELARFTGFHMNGGFADYVLAQSYYVLPIPDTISDIDAAPLLCAGIVGFRSLRLSDLEPGERLGLFGFGAAGHLAIQVACHWGCEVYVFTRSERHRHHAERLGAAWTGGAEDTPPNLIDRGIIFAPAGWIVPLALQKLRPGGTIAINAIHMSDIPQMPFQLVYGERTIRSVANATYQDGVDFLNLAAEIPIKPEVTLYPLADANMALRDMKASAIDGEAVLEINDARSRIV